MANEQPQVNILADINGAGKTTTSRSLLVAEGLRGDDEITHSKDSVEADKEYLRWLSRRRPSRTLLRGSRWHLTSAA